MRILALALLVGATLGCDRLLGIEDLPRPAQSVDAGGDTSPVATINAECVACTQAQCKELRNVCMAESRCSALVGCLDKCPVNDVTCRATCERTSGGASALANYLSFDSCRRERCVGACYGTKGLLASISSNCACADDVCGAQALSCIQSALGEPGREGEALGGCERRIECMAGRVNPDVFVECADKATGGAEYNALLDCAKATPCSTKDKACPLSFGELACVDSYKYGNARSGDVNVTVGVSSKTLAKIGENVAIPDAEVTACAPGSCASCIPVVSGVTDAMGKATLKIPMTSLGQFTGCFRVKPPKTSTAVLPDLMIYSGRSIHTNEDQMWSILVEESVLGYYAALEGSIDADWTKYGQAIGTLHDCVWGRTVDATLELSPPGDANTLIRYLKADGVPDPAAKGTMTQASFAIVNIPPGRHTILAKKDGKTIASLVIDATAGVLLDANMYPRALP